MRKGFAAEEILVHVFMNAPDYFFIPRIGRVNINRSYILQNINRASKSVSNWEGFCKLPVVKWVIESEDHVSFLHLYELQVTFFRVAGRADYYGKLTACPLMCIMYDNCFANPLQAGVFLLNYTDNTYKKFPISSMWKADIGMVEHKEWWYALLRHGWKPQCKDRDRKVQKAFVAALSIWKTQSYVALLVFVLARRDRRLGRSKDVARLIATEVMKTNWLSL